MGRQIALRGRPDKLAWHIFRYRFSLRTLFLFITVNCVLLYLGIHRFAPSEYGRAAQFVELSIPETGEPDLDRLPEVHSLAALALHLDGFEVHAGRFRASEYRSSKSKLVDVNYELPDRFGQYQFAFGSQNWPVESDFGARLTDRSGQSADVIVRVNTRRQESGAGQACLIARLEFRAHTDRLRLPYAQPVAQDKCLAVLQQINQRFKDGCAKNGFADVRWE